MSGSRGGAIVRALIRSTAKSLFWSVLFLSPGFAALAAEQRAVGSLLLFVGSFLLVARTYRKDWRLSGFSISIGPLCAVACLAVQWEIFGRAAPSMIVVGVSVGVGLVLGIWRARTHAVYVKERVVFAKRTLGYLLVWAASYGVALACAQARFLPGMRIGFAGSIVSTVMLCVLGQHLWRHYRGARARLSGAAAGWLLGGGLLLAASSSDAQSGGASTVLDSILRDAVAPQGGSWSAPFARSSSSFNGVTRAIEIQYGGDKSFLVIVRLRKYGSAGACHDEGRRVVSAVNRGVGIGRSKRESDPFPDVTPLSTGKGGLAKSGSVWDVRSLGVGDHSASWRGKNSWYGNRSDVMVCEARIYSGVWRIVVDAPMLIVPQRAGPRHPRGRSQFDIQGALERAALVAKALYHRLPSGGAPSAGAGDSNRTSGGGSAGSGPSTGGGRSTGGGGWARGGGTGSGLLGPDVSTGGLPKKAEMVAAIAALILILGGVGAAVAESIAQELAQQTMAEEAAPRRRKRPRRPAPPREEPPPVDPRTGHPFPRGRGESFVDPDTGELLTREQAELRAVDIGEEARRQAREEQREQERFAKQRQKEQERFERETRRRQAELSARAEEEYEQLRREVAERKRAVDDLGHIERAATKFEDDEILARMEDSRIFGEDGRLDVEYMRKLSGIMRQRLSREVGAPDEALEGYAGDWAVEAVAKTIDDASSSVVVRMGTGILSGGSSEVFWQSWTAGASMKEAAEKAADEGREMGFGEAYGRGLKSVAEQNAPTATVKAIGRWRKGEDVSWAEIGLSVVGDVLGTVGLIGDARSVAGGLTRGMDSVRTGLKHGFTPGLMRELSQNVRYTPNTGMLDAFARNTMDPDSFRNLSNAVKGAKKSLTDQVRGAFRKMGLHPETPSHRLTPEQAAARFDETRLTDNIAGKLEQLRGDDSLQHLDEAFHRGRAAGREKITGLQQSIDRLDQLKKSGAGADEVAKAQRAVRDDVLRVQADKHALNEMNRLPRVEGENETIRSFNQEMKGIYHETDIRVKERLAAEYGVRPEDVREVEITNMAGGAQRVDPSALARDQYGLASKKVKGGGVESPHGVQPTHGASPQPGPAPTAHGKKVSFDRDLTMRVRTVDANGNVVWKDIPSNTTGRVYNEELAKVALGRSDVMPSKGMGFENTHLDADDHLTDVVKILDSDKLAKRLDQATTDRLHPEAYGTGQADLDAATKDAYRGRDLTDAGAVAKTVEFKVHHWMKEAEELTAAAGKAGDPARARHLLQQATAHQEEGMRQLVKQYKNMGITRTNKMIALDNAAGASIPKPLAEGMAVLKGVQDGHYSAPQAEAILKRMSMSTEQLAHEFSAYVEGLQTLRKAPFAVPVNLFPSVRLGREDE